MSITSAKSPPDRRTNSTKISKIDLFDSQFGNIKLSKPHRACSVKRMVCFWRQKPSMMTQEELDQLIRRLHKCCLIHLQDSYKVHINRLKGLDLMEELIDRANFRQLRSVQVMSLIWCILSCVHHFFIRLRTTRGLADWVRRRKARRSMRIYETLIGLTLPAGLINSVIHAIITFYTESKMWNTEYLCAQLLKRLLYISAEGETTVHAILDIAEKSSVTNAREARQVVRVLYQVLEKYPWMDMDESLMYRLLMMFHKSIMPESRDVFDYGPLRKGLEVCIRHVLENLPNSNLLKIIRTMMQWTLDDEVSDEALLDFGNVLEYAAMLHETFLYRDALHHDLFPLVLEMISSENRLHSLLGNRVLQFLLDRHNNKVQFDTPRIYFDDIHFNVTVGQYNKEDKAFARKYREMVHTTLLASIQQHGVHRIYFDDIHFNVTVGQYNTEDKAFARKYREMVHTTLLASIQQHGVHRINLESTYTSIAIIVVEIPCGYTAAAVVCLAMAIQEYTLSNDGLELDCSHRLHATVMAIMSLVCWVHSATVFYDYLKAVVARRAKYAPHLNPPLRAIYEYAQHHILWNKPELFFEDWEARYGLWKCFRTRRTRLASFTNIKNTSENEIS